MTEKCLLHWTQNSTDGKAAASFDSKRMLGRPVVSEERCKKDQGDSLARRITSNTLRKGSPRDIDDCSRLLGFHAQRGLSCRTSRCTRRHSLQRCFFVGAVRPFICSPDGRGFDTSQVQQLSRITPQLLHLTRRQKPSVSRTRIGSHLRFSPHTGRLAEVEVSTNLALQHDAGATSSVLP